jgi:hypothetical protein
MNGDVTKSSGCNLNNKLNGKKRINNGFFLFRLHPETSVCYQRDDQIFHPIGRLGKTPAFKVGKSNIWQLRVRAPVPMVFQAREYFFGGPMYGWLKQCHDGSDMTRTGHFGCSSR